MYAMVVAVVSVRWTTIDRGVGIAAADRVDVGQNPVFLSLRRVDRCGSVVHFAGCPASASRAKTGGAHS